MLIYASGGGLMAVSYSVQGNTFVADKPRVWIANPGKIRDADLAPDGKRLLVLTPVESGEAPKREHEVVFLFNFFDECTGKHFKARRSMASSSSRATRRFT